MLLQLLPLNFTRGHHFYHQILIINANLKHFYRQILLLNANSKQNRSPILLLDFACRLTPFSTSTTTILATIIRYHGDTKPTFPPSPSSFPPIHSLLPSSKDKR